MATMSPTINISIGKGGTFCDVIASVDDGRDFSFKLLSEDPDNYDDAPTEAIRRVLEVIEKRPISKSEMLDGSSIANCRIGTTVATNALLEGKGQKFALLVTKGFRDVCAIGDQTRPHLFDLEVRKPVPLHDTVVEIDERITIEHYDLDPFPRKEASIPSDPDLVQSASGETVRILEPLDPSKIRLALEKLRDDGYTSLAISLMHSYAFPDHEQEIVRIAKDVGFRFVSAASAESPLIKYIRRSSSICSEAYLFPIVHNYISHFQAGFQTLPKRLEFICSDGGLKSSSLFKANDALLSGPAGGVVGIAHSCYNLSSAVPLIGFDMGGTSTDVARYDGTFDYLAETSIAGRSIATPMLNIATVAAGGGSILTARDGLLLVGPESAGAYPGPACYRKGGPLTVTDANLFLGRLSIPDFPTIFGPHADQPLDLDIVQKKFNDLAGLVNAQTGRSLSAEMVASGFLEVANEAMSRPIRNATETRGFAPENHHLVAFGGSGGQHACSIADKLGIRRVLVHKHSSMLSAYGIAHAKLQSQASAPWTGAYSKAGLPAIKAQLHNLRIKLQQELVSQGAVSDDISYGESLSLRYHGTDTTISIARPADEDYAESFRATHLREFAFTLQRPIIVDSISVRATNGRRTTSVPAPTSTIDSLIAESVQTDPHKTQRLFIDGTWQDSGVYRLDSMRIQPSKVAGPALLLDDTQTILVEPSFTAFVLPEHVVLEKSDNRSYFAPALDVLDPVQLSIFSHRFMSIAEQMGTTLQRTSISTSIKERLDFSCALFSPDGKLVANAPHIPIHLGSMQYAIQYQHKLWSRKLLPGDVLLTNHPDCGGTHLPDLTVVTPVFINDSIAFYVASRGHHTDIGGRGITSMMPSSKYLWEEGLNVKSMKIVKAGEFMEDEVRDAFLRAADFPGCSATRRLEDNISDLKAQTSANQRGIILLQKLCYETNLETVHKHMRDIQATSECAVRAYLKTVKKQHPQGLSAADTFDDGTRLELKITIDDAGSAIYDWEGTDPQSFSNYNCPVSITYSAVIYTIRCLIGKDIPLNDGCLAPVTIKLPKDSILRPGSSAAICGSTLASQRVIDTILRAFGCCAAFAGCANSFGWGIGGKDPLTGKVEPGWNYGESLGGGCGAGPTWHGEHATQIHSTNTKITDPEIVEKRTPVIVRKHAINNGTGGKGQFTGGSGATREIEARIPLKFSILSDRRVFAPYGMVGGEPGSVGRNYVFRWNQDRSALEKVALGGKAELSLEAGEMIQINTPGGGGWGPAP